MERTSTRVLCSVGLNTQTNRLQSVGRTQRVRVGGQLSKEVKVTSGVPQGSVLGPPLFLVYLSDIWRSIDSSIRLFADDCIIYREITNEKDIVKLQKDLDTLGEWAVENGMKINLSKCKAIRFTRAPAGSPLGYSLCNQEIPNASSFKDLRIVIRSDSNWVDHVNYIAQTRWKAHHFVRCVLKNGSTNTRSLAYTSFVRPVLEYVAACWDPCGEGKIKGLDRAQTKAAQFTDHTKDSDWKRWFSLGR